MWPYIYSVRADGRVGCLNRAARLEQKPPATAAVVLAGSIHRIPSAREVDRPIAGDRRKPASCPSPALRLPRQRRPSAYRAFLHLHLRGCAYARRPSMPCCVGVAPAPRSYRPPPSAVDQICMPGTKSLPLAAATMYSPPCAVSNSPDAPPASAALAVGARIGPVLQSWPLLTVVPLSPAALAPSRACDDFGEVRR
nr:unnamed protein product [Digitaria exilis]